MLTEEVTLELEYDLLFDLMMMAHKRDITLNQLVNQVLANYMLELKNLPADLAAGD